MRGAALGGLFREVVCTNVLGHLAQHVGKACATRWDTLHNVLVQQNGEGKTAVVPFRNEGLECEMRWKVRHRERGVRVDVFCRNDGSL